VTGGDHALLNGSIVSSDETSQHSPEHCVAHFGAAALWTSASRDRTGVRQVSGSAAHPVPSMHTVAVAVTLVRCVPPDIARMRWPGPSAPLPHPAVAAPHVISVRPHKTRARRCPDGAKNKWRRRSEGHARIEGDMIAGRQRQGSQQGYRCCRNSKFGHKFLVLRGFVF